MTYVRKYGDRSGINVNTELPLYFRPHGAAFLTVVAFLVIGVIST